MNDIRKISGASGLLFVVLLVVAFALPGEPPMIDDPNADILAYLEDNRSNILVAQWMTFLSLIPAFLFFGYFVVRLRQAEGDAPARALAALSAIVATAVFVNLCAVIFATGGFGAGHGLNEEDARLLWNLGGVATAAQLSTIGAFGLFSGWIILAKKGLPAWTGWLGLAVGVLGLLSSACLASDGAFALLSPLAVLPGFLSFAIYTVAVSVVFLREK